MVIKKLLLISCILTVVKPNHNGNADTQKEGIFENTNDMFFHKKLIFNDFQSSNDFKPLEDFYLDNFIYIE